MTGFTAGARRRARGTAEYQAEAAILRAEIEAEFEPLLAKAGFFRRLRLRYQCRRRIEQAVAEIAPDRALYL
jgi:hypothetical protein